MEDDTLLRCPVGERHLQGVLDQLGAHVVGQRPADHLAASQVDDGGQVGPPLPGGDVGDVAHVATVDLLARPELALDEIQASSASGSAMVVFLHRFLHLPSSPANRMSLVTRRLPQAHLAVAELLVDPG